MIHPSRLLRVESGATSQFTAPRNIDLKLENFDCGLSFLPGLKPKIQKYAKVSTFLPLLILVAFLQGCIDSYFRDTYHIWRQEFKINNHLAEYVIFLGEIFRGIFALIIGYYGFKIHRISWLSGLMIFQAISGWMIIISELKHPVPSHLNVTSVAIDDYLCKKDDRKITINIMNDIGSSNIAVILLITHQFFSSSTFISMITHGLTYADDHIRNKHAAYIISIIFAVYYVGRYIGTHMTLVPIYFNRYIYFSFSWLLLQTVLFITAVIISLFPKILPSKLMENGVGLILNTTTYLHNKSDCFISITKRVFANKTIVLNCLAAGFMSIAIVNFELISDVYFRSQFHDISIGDHFYKEDDNLSSKFILQILITVLICLTMLIIGGIISKIKPNGRILVGCIIAFYSLIVCLFAGFSFIKCEQTLFSDHRKFISYINADCKCTLDQYAPVCIQEVTYFTACHAGCKTKFENNYLNCRDDGVKATKGACNCNYMWYIVQGFVILMKALLSGSIIVQYFINMKAVTKSEDKPYSLALYLTITKVLPYIPFKILYIIFEDYMCIKRNSKNECTFYRKHFSTYINISTIILMVTSIILATFMLKTIKSINLYETMKQKTKRFTMQEAKHDNVAEASENATVFTPLNQILESTQSDTSLSNGNYSLEDINNALGRIDENPNANLTKHASFSETTF